MCGIVAYIGTEKAGPILFDTLKRLEYRGYDSAGIAVSSNGSMEVLKAAGRISDLEIIYRSKGEPGGSMGIGHTRWATHGRPSDENAHPHTSGSIAVVHNGIIENYLELREQLRDRGLSSHRRRTARFSRTSSITTTMGRQTGSLQHQSREL